MHKMAFSKQMYHIVLLPTGLGRTNQITAMHVSASWSGWLGFTLQVLHCNLTLGADIVSFTHIGLHPAEFELVIWCFELADSGR